jgi:hypothetical protein
MLKDEIIKTLNDLFAKFKVPLKIKDLFLYRPVMHELPFEDFEPIHEAKRLITCNPLCVELDYEFNNYNFSYHLECVNEKGTFAIKEQWLKNSDIYPVDTKDMTVDEKEITKKSGIAEFSSVLVRMLSLACQDAS